MAEAEAEAGETEAALATIDETLALAGETGEHWYDAELHRIRGEILLKQNPADSAAPDAAFLAAIAVAQQQVARSFEPRAALSLEKLYQSTRRPIDATTFWLRRCKAFRRRRGFRRSRRRRACSRRSARPTQ